jgi:hypothetical protein
VFSGLPPTVTKKLSFCAFFVRRFTHTRARRDLRPLLSLPLCLRAVPHPLQCSAQQGDIGTAATTASGRLPLSSPVRLSKDALVSLCLRTVQHVSISAVQRTRHWHSSNDHQGQWLPQGDGLQEGVSGALPRTRLSTSGPVGGSVQEGPTLCPTHAVASLPQYLSRRHRLPETASGRLEEFWGRCFQVKPPR